MVFHYRKLKNKNPTLYTNLAENSILTTVLPFCSCFHHPARTVQQLWATLHQLHQREVAAVLQSPHVHPWARRIPARRHWVDVHWLRHGSSANNWPDWEGTSRWRSTIKIINQKEADQSQWTKSRRFRWNALQHATATLCHSVSMPTKQHPWFCFLLVHVNNQISFQMELIYHEAETRDETRFSFFIFRLTSS